MIVKENTHEDGHKSYVVREGDVEVEFNISKGNSPVINVENLGEMDAETLRQRSLEQMGVDKEEP